MQRDLKPKAVQLRKLGKTYSEIQAILGDIPKGTLSGWLKPVELSSAQKSRIEKKMKIRGHTGRQRGAWRNHQKRVERIRSISDQAIREYRSLSKNQMFLVGLVLYLAEGSKKSESFQFMNSDPKLIKIMISWTVKVGNIDFKDLRFRLYIHEIYASENCEAFWLKELGAEPEQLLRTIYKPTVRLYKKNPDYRGCLRIEVRGTELYWKTLAWRDCLYNSL